MASSLTYVVPDLHGRADLLDRALHRIQGSARFGTVIFLGDYIDRGPDSAGVIARLRAGPPTGWIWHCLRGNHEQMALQAPSDAQMMQNWRRNGGDAALASYGGEITAQDMAWMSDLPMIHADPHRVYVHAGVQPEYNLDEMPEAIALWHRYPRTADEGYRGRHVVHGHTPVRDGPLLLEWRSNLDCGAVFTGRLAVGVFDDAASGGPVDVLWLE
ncbi:metallophosphoesterase family protein [Thalassococcus sp. S3]|uniref:metallophosphoesterase family protein n=1 Tax=Thalassococcus sp. S3 TaxID=2017482 RepID=UPI0010242E1D|nr:metallophosphoesterase family protein [Thalassococcus sp. S3]QBF33971.1 serine/threonine protein phosphatase [Thalassococcus sp. S3]